jgi:hypothetical protein
MEEVDSFDAISKLSLRNFLDKTKLMDIVSVNISLCFNRRPGLSPKRGLLGKVFASISNNTNVKFHCPYKKVFEQSFKTLLINNLILASFEYCECNGNRRFSSTCHQTKCGIFFLTYFLCHTFGPNEKI